ncbi:MAG: LamG domain-containing protein [Candidatus Sumerlaeia bacterium]|nr:LamG domain-containing protein [Candidatus Sumerlaeia bacterium]
MRIGNRFCWVLSAAFFAAGLAQAARTRPEAQAKPATKNQAMALDTDAHLVGWWKFDETSGKTAADASKHRRDGILEGGLSFDTHSAPGRIGLALRLDGKGCVRISGFKGIAGTRPRTTAVWIKTDSPTGEIVSWGLSDFGKMWTMGFIRSHVGVTPKGGYYYMKMGIHDSQWHHVAATVKEGSPPNLHDHARLYLDGLPAEVDDIGLLDLWPIDTGEAEDVKIGQRLKGLLDDLRLYDRALSDDEIKALFDLGSDSKEKGKNP